MIEILSPDDRTSVQLARYRDFWNRGVRQIFIFDPEMFTCFQYADAALIERQVKHLVLPDGRQVPFPSAELLNQLREELRRE